MSCYTRCRCDPGGTGGQSAPPWCNLPASAHPPPPYTHTYGSKQLEAWIRQYQGEGTRGCHHQITIPPTGLAREVTDRTTTVPVPGMLNNLRKGKKTPKNEPNVASYIIL
ncbi:hypothetical protein ElyMa_004046200 [Elysia marginata]|uniref:Uncharacterized protein n=1 Tax=Elysia marginata TaxID=1093978 RepID=A0AAV4G775_9GAST|nr:hypothetical protein ElyMa_004046200 [Elysia marginata]